ncbi:carbohydrate kinase family protein [Patescibacteria group bacterium]|nr:carbohydrate kinase family protein [Patescibacteria group bacterium]MBU1922491.1 carbohydrate kinase family protein [Patescibacteria group bacterium]
MFDIITIGSATRDVFLQSSAIKIKPSKTSPTGLDECLPLGAKIELKDIIFDTGGGATNAGATFANLGLKTAAICRLGKDLGGLEIGQILKNHGISNKFLQLDDKLGTAYSVILLAGTGQRSILVYRGASQNISLKEIPWSQVKTNWLYVTSLAGNLALIKRLWQFAKKNKIKIAWNPGGKELDWGIARLTPFIKQTAFFTVNTEEAAKLTRQKRGDIKSAAKKLKNICKCLSLTNGSKGAYAWQRGQTLFAPALKVKRINATGAGDAFGSGFVVGLLKKNNLAHALKMGVLNANMVITKMGAKNGLLKKMPSRKELRRVKVKKINL